ncbi:MAG: hypothetical protein KKC37_06085 [Proteobacteria bacterium]|nr:hypothetical protein [Pseudomonadota bacterium]
MGICLDREQTTAVYDDQGRVIEGQKGEDARAAFTEATRLGGDNPLGLSVDGVPVHSLMGISRVIEVLYRDQTPVLVGGKWEPISPELKARFDDYQRTYGP